MSYHHLSPFEAMDEEDFFDEMDDHNYGEGVADEALDDYEIVCFLSLPFLLSLAEYCWVYNHP